MPANRCGAHIEEESDGVLGEAATWDGNPPSQTASIVRSVDPPPPTSGWSLVCYYASSPQFLICGVVHMFRCRVDLSRCVVLRLMDHDLQRSSHPDIYHIIALEV